LVDPFTVTHRVSIALASARTTFLILIPSRLVEFMTKI
jgi:hypothetical protein